ncbi:hypothetical protein Pmani_026418 [Petrolisthes manimaculis]|uniref:Uncharacterized protein n=1 Tax=Petrolisthes manimaculis TaxID=1843537 RepID=A0AAE1P677_9EUCA|nr:hypothetical protein Pmani_026418 [Petrolisthes manimaculis]
MHDVDRYRGSCLIASKPRGGRGHPRGRAPPQDANQSQQQMSSASLDNGSTGYLLEGGSALAGMPLFSLLPQRRGSLRHPRPHIHLNHHHSHHSHHTHHNTHHQQQHQQHHQQQQHHHHRIHRSVSHPPPLEVGVNSENGPGRGQEIIDEVERLPLARLALHTQGAPLVLATCSPQRHTPLCPTPQQGREITDGEGSLPTASDAVSVTSDEGSTGHDNCLPRIIKPRKRRKKDRKPTGGSSPTGSVEGGIRGEGDVNVDGDSGGTIVTLKPYLPMCYNYQCRGHHDLSEPRRCQISRTCGCGTCVPGHVFPTPPPSPASSSSSSSSSVLCNMSSASSSCSSSEDEPTAGCCGEIEEVGVGLQCGAEDGTSSGPSVGEGRSQLVRSLSEPQATNNNNHNNNNILHISSSITNSFAGHRDLDIRIGGSWRHELSPRTRHYSVPPPAARPTLPRGGLHYYLPATCITNTYTWFHAFVYSAHKHTCPPAH